MSKMQIAAKGLLVLLGFKALSYFSYDFFEMIPSRVFGEPDAYSTFALLSWMFLLLVGICILYFLVFNNNFLARRIAGKGTLPPLEEQRFWMTAGLRLTLVFIGLFLIDDIVVMVVKIFFAINLFLKQGLIYGDGWKVLRVSIDECSRIALQLIKAALGIYLLLGARWFINWNLKKLEKESFIKTVTEQ